MQFYLTILACDPLELNCIISDWMEDSTSQAMVSNG